MGNPLRDRRTPSELAASGQCIDFSRKITEFGRLAGIVREDLATLKPDKLPAGWRDALVAGHLSFGFADAQGSCPAVEGNVSATIDAVCQRCLEPLKLPLVVELRLLFADSLSAAFDEGDYDIWELEDDRLRPQDLVEEALIMAMPYAVLHVDDPACCGPATDADTAAGTTRPFATLKAQMERAEEDTNIE